MFIAGSHPNQNSYQKAQEHYFHARLNVFASLLHLKENTMGTLISSEQHYSLMPRQGNFDVNTKGGENVWRIISKNKEGGKMIPLIHLLMKGNIFCMKEMIFDKHRLVEIC